MSDHPKHTPKRWGKQAYEEPSSSSKDRPPTQSRVKFEDNDSPRPTRPKPYVKTEKDEEQSNGWDAPGNPYKENGTKKAGGKGKVVDFFCGACFKTFFKGEKDGWPCCNESYNFIVTEKGTIKIKKAVK